MELDLLQIGDYSYKGDYLAHITEMINVKLTKGDTYNDLFEKLRKLFEGDEDKKKAVQEWIDFNHAEQEDVDVFKTVLVDEGTEYAAFNLH